MDLYLGADFNESNEYKWSLIFYKLQLQRDFVTFSSVQKDRFAKILIHFFLQLQQVKDDENLFFQGYIQNEKVIELFTRYYPDIIGEIKLHIADKTYGVTGFLKDCLAGLQKIGLIRVNPALDSSISLNIDLIQTLNQEITSKVNINDDIDMLLNSTSTQSIKDLRPSVSGINHESYVQN